jgi:iron(III) transport system substrate-binding protein
MKNLLNKRVLFLIFLSLVVVELLFVRMRYQQAKSSNNIPPIDSATSGKITIYSSFPEEMGNEYIAAFNKEYPNILVDIVYSHPISITEQILNEQHNTEVDVVWGVPHRVVIFLEWGGLLKGYAPNQLGNIKTAFRDTNTNPYWFGLSGRMIAFCTNPTKLAELKLEPPKSWEDLTKPEYKGLLSFPDPETTQPGYLVIAALLELKGAISGWNYIDQLHQNVGEFTNNRIDSCQHISAGEYPIGVGFVEQTKPDPATLNIVFPTEGAIWQMDTAALINKDSIQLASKTFIEWSISNQAMTLYSKISPIKATNPTTETNTVLPEGYTPEVVDGAMHEDFAWIAANYNHIINEWHTRYQDK